MRRWRVATSSRGWGPYPPRMEAGTVGVGSSRGAGVRSLAVPLLGAAVMAATLAYGLIATAQGIELGTATPPLLYEWRPRVDPLALLAAALLAASVVVTPRLLARDVSPLLFASAALAVGLVLRLTLGAARGGVDSWWDVYQLPNFESGNEYLPALPGFELGTRYFLDTFAEIGTALPVHAVGHPPGLLTLLYLLGIDSAEGMAALTIGVGALSVPLTYLLARELLEERHARVATLLYLFAPSAVLHGATSADALFATLGVLAAAALLARRRVVRILGPPALALASFFSYAHLAVGAVAAIVAMRRDGLRQAVVLSAGCAGALVVFYGLLHLATGFDPVGAIQSAEIVYRAGVASGRPYVFWLFGSPVAFLIAAGLPLAWLGLRALGAGHAMAVALFAVIGLSAALGFTKAETERIYLFLVPMLCVAAATALPERRVPAVLGALAVQALATETLFWTVW